MRVSENGKRLCALYCRIGGVSEMDREMLEHQCWTLQTFAHKEGFEIAGSISALETGLLSHRPSIDDLVKICIAPVHVLSQRCIPPYPDSQLPAPEGPAPRSRCGWPLASHTAAVHERHACQ